MTKLNLRYELRKREQTIFDLKCSPTTKEIYGYSPSRGELILDAISRDPKIIKLLEMIDSGEAVMLPKWD